MKLVREIRDGIVDSTTSLSTILRKAKILAVMLGNTDFRSWVDFELNGYSGEAELPSYRMLRSPVLGTFSGPLGQSVKGYQLPVALMPDDFKGMADAIRFGHPIKEIETHATNEAVELRHPWPTEAVLLLRDDMQLTGGFMLVEIYQPITKAQLDGIIDAVRNRLLDFLLGLQDVDPKILDSEEAIADIPKDTVSQVFNVAIHGDHNVLASGTDISQQVTQHINTYDKRALFDYLKDIGVETDDLDALDQAIAADGKPAGHTLGARVKEWLGRITGKAVDGTWKTAMAAAPTLLIKAISKYYGWQ